MRKIYFILFSAITMLFGVTTSASAEDVDMSDYFTNLGFGEGEWNSGGWYDTCPGWDINYETFMSSGDSNIWPKAYDESWMPSNMSEAVLYAWADGTATATSGTKLCSQVSSEALPAGTYTVSALVCANMEGISLYAEDADGNQIAEAVAVSSSETDATVATTLTITLESESTLEIGLIANTDLTYSGNLFVDDFSVTQTTTTGISAIQTVATSSNAIYNIQGMRVSDISKKGLYIVNGKKLLVK